MNFFKGLRDSFQAGVDRAFGVEEKKGGNVQADTRAKIRNILSQLGIDHNLDPKGLKASLIAKVSAEGTSDHELAQIRHVLDLIKKL